MWEWAGLDGSRLEGEESVEAATSGFKGSKVVTVPQLSSVCHRLVLLRGTQGSWKAWGDEGGLHKVVHSRRGLWSGRGLSEE